jgi:hypothetical protein
MKSVFSDPVFLYVTFAGWVVVGLIVVNKIQTARKWEEIIRNLNEYKARAEKAEEKLKILINSSSNEKQSPAEILNEKSRFRSLKIAIAKRLHPDSMGEEDPDKGLKSRIFSEIWSDIERIERQ